MPYLDVVIHSFTTLFVIIDPLGLAPIFASLSAGDSVGSRAQLSRRATLIAAAILILFALTGKALLKAMGITMAAFQIAGGIMLFLLAVEMLFEKRTERRQKNVEHQTEDTFETGSEDIAVFPLATPLLAGPGTMGAVILITANTRGSLAREGIVILMLLAVMAISLLLLLVAGRLEKLLGVTGMRVINRVFGILLCSLAVQFVFDGIRDSGLL